MFYNILKQIFFKLVEFYNFIFNVYGYYVYQIEMTYNFDGKTEFYTKNKFWLNEKKYLMYDGTPDEHWVDVTNNYLTIGKAPPGVTDILYRIKYRYNKKSYTCLTDDPATDVSKIKAPDMAFKLPLKEVKLLDEDNQVIRDVTKKYMKLLGPNSNFHNYLTPKVYDLFMYNNYKYIQITNIIGQSKTFDINSTLDQLL